MYFIQRVLSNNLGSRDVVGWAPRWKQPSTSSPESVEAGRTRTESVVSVFSAVRVLSPVELCPRGRNKHRTSLLGEELVAVAVTVTSRLSILEMQQHASRRICGVRAVAVDSSGFMLWPGCNSGSADGCTIPASRSRTAWTCRLMISLLSLFRGPW